jgi:UDP-GlcNAc:undecaprenyl-phosphate/decaprenyl-phosphate GlcNAc-1-phosphate transferase
MHKNDFRREKEHMRGQGRIRRHIIYFIALILFAVLIMPAVRGWFLNRGGVRWLHILLISSTLTFIITPLVKYFTFKFKILDHPDVRKVHSSPTPLLGGIGIYIAFLVSVWSNAIFTKEVFAIMIGASIVLLSGILDDILKLSAKIRLLFQFLAVTILLFNGISIIIFKQNWLGILLNFLITYFWIIGLTNSTNFFDGMDGLVPGLSIIISFFIGTVAFQTNQPFLGWLAIAIMGGCIGFMPYNFGLRKAAEIFLGDSGSNFLGFTLASIAVMGEWSERSMVSSLVTPLLIFSILIYDMIYITISRSLTGKVRNLEEWLNYVGKDHLHHRMANLLLSNKKSVLFIFLLSFTLGLNALLLRNTDAISSMILLIQAICILVIITVIEITGNRKREENSG